MAGTSLDDPRVYEGLDPQRLRDRIAALPDQIEEAWSAARDLPLPEQYTGSNGVAVLGMGGSGIGGALLQALALALNAPAPVTVVRGYRLPAHVSPGTLVIASSNSGDTEETVSAFGEALARDARCIAITAGGRMAAMAREAGVPLLHVRWAHEPRAALGWSFASLLAICGRVGLLPDQRAALTQVLASLRARADRLGVEVPEPANEAKQLARRLHGRLPVVIGAEAMAPVAYRWRTQINENAKSWALSDELPELSHNAQAGFGLPQRVVPLLHAVLLRHAAMHPRNALRVDATADELRRSGVSVEIVQVDGDGVLAQMLHAVLLGDFASYYLGLLNGVQPSPVEPLVRLKAWLAER